MDQDPMVVAPSDGVVRGDTKSMPNRGTSVGFTGVGNDSYGADVSQSATNARGSAHLSPDPMDECYPQGGGDYRSGGDGTPASPGTGMGGAAKSDAAGEDDPSTQQIPAIAESEPAGDED
jgi:hypothetical protein